MRKLWLLCLVLCLLLTGCAGDTVIYQVQCDHDDLPQSTPQPTPEVTEEALKTGLAVITDTTASRSAEAAVYDLTVVALTVDDDGVIRDCRVDGVDTQLPFDTTGTVTGSFGGELLSRRERDEGYETDDDEDEWYDDAEDLAERAVGKTAAELRLAAGDAPQSVLAAIEKAAAQARHLGAQTGEKLHLALIANLDGSNSATDSEAGRARLACDVAAVTLQGDTITSCRIDSVQADVPFDAMGTITGELSDSVKTKTELREDYGMKAYGGAKYEWYEQAENFARYVTGKTVAEVGGIPLNDGKAAQADLYASVTITVTPLQAIVLRACAGD